MRGELAYALRRHYESDHKSKLAIYPLLLPGVTPAKLPPFLSTFQAEALPEQMDDGAYRGLAERLLSAVAADAEDGTAAPDDGVEPFPGLEAFDETNAQFYFGRQAEETLVLPIELQAHKIGRSART